MYVRADAWVFTNLIGGKKESMFYSAFYIYVETCDDTLKVYFCSITLFGPRQANLVLIAYANSEGSGEPTHPRSLVIQAVSQEEPSTRKPDPWSL